MFALTDWLIPFEHPMYGWYHIAWIIITIIASICIAIFPAKKHDKKQDDKIVFISGLVLLLLEVYKQALLISTGIKTGIGYNLNDLPFQFCSTPMYVMTIAPLLKEGKVKNALYKFLAFFGCLAGISVLVYPTVVPEATYLTLLFHTMIWHCSMVIIGVYIIVSRNYGKSLKDEIIPGFYVFATLCGIATILNFVLPNTFFAKTDWINFFYISYYHGSSLPIFSSMYSYGDTFFAWIGLIAAYLVAFTLGATLVFGVTKLINTIRAKSSSKKIKGNVA